MATVSAIRERAVLLAGGRRLAWSATGPYDGVPVIYLHGAIGTPVRRTEELDAVIAGLGIRYIAVSWPGFGGSDPCPGRRIADFPADVERLADRLGLDHFTVVGVSAGGPYAIACAGALADRVVAAAAVNRCRRCARRTRGAGCPRIDDYLTTCAGWGLELRDVAAEVHLWHGEQDRFVPVEHARALAAALPRCRAVFDPDDGHFFFRRRLAEVLGALVAAYSGRYVPKLQRLPSGSRAL